MSPPDALLERTRAACLERARLVRNSLEATRHPQDPRLTTALRELHAIKGEATMGGLRSIGKLAHALESLLLRRRAEEPFYIEDACDALHVLSELLSTTSAEALNEAPDVEELIAEVEAAGGASGGKTKPIRSSRAPARASHRPALSEPGAVGGATTVLEVSVAPAEPTVTTKEQRRTNGAGRTGWLRVEAKSIDDLSSLISEVASDLDGMRNQLAGLTGSTGQGTGRMWQDLSERFDGLRSRVAHMEERAWSLRLVPIATPLQELADHVQGLSRQLGKQVRARVDAGGVALERSVVETLREPLLHLARNAVDHGIEPVEQRGSKPASGQIRFKAESQGSEILIAVEDDGAGLDADAIRRRAVESKLISAERARVLSREEVLDLVFVNGFSQRDQASEVSGRGVGLSAVRSSLEGLGGAVRLTTTLGQGARFELVLPAAVARERVLVVESAGLCWAIPARWVRTIVRDPDALVQARSERMLRTQQGLVPARPLNAWLGAPREEDAAALVVEIAGRRAALLVARIASEVDLLRTPADPLLSFATRVAASGILPDGRVSFFLRWGEVLREAAQLTEEEIVVAPRARARVPRVMIVDDSAVIRDIVGEVLAGAGVEVKSAIDGKEALELIERQQFDLVISDIEMPRMDGLELLQILRKKSTVLPVIMLTTRSKPENRREAALLGANAYIAKSEFHGDTLMEVVRRFVDLPA